MIGNSAAALLGLPLLQKLQQERRRHQRVKVSLLGRYMLADRREFPCQTIDMSPGGVALFAPVKANVGDRVVAYIDQIGRIEGPVARHIENGFAMSWSASMAKREKLAEQLTWLANRHALRMPEDRRHERIVPRMTRTSAKMPDGTLINAKIIDVSLSGVAVQAAVQTAIGMTVSIGQTQGKVVRIFDGGFAIEFMRLLPEATFSDMVRL